MRCPDCGHDNLRGTRFCVQCGTRLPVVCPNCGAAIVPGNRFCGQCGTQHSEVPAPVPTPVSEGRTGGVAEPGAVEAVSPPAEPPKARRFHGSVASCRAMRLVECS